MKKPIIDTDDEVLKQIVKDYPEVKLKPNEIDDIIEARKRKKSKPKKRALVKDCGCK